MKKLLNCWTRLLMGGWTAVLILTSCVNQIADEVEVGTVPINFSVQVQKAGTKVTGNVFDSGDETTKGARAPHLMEQKIVLAESDESRNLTFHWDKIFLPE